jgi:hypothetical protein
MKRKIISLVENYGYQFKYADQKFLTEEKEIDGMTFPIGHLDVQWEKEKLPILLCFFENKSYYSVLGETTIEMLNEGRLDSDKDYNIKIETELDSEFSKYVISFNVEHSNKYNEDPQYLEYLGLPSIPVEEETETLTEE